LTAHTRRDSTRKSGPFRRASARPGGTDGQAANNRDTVPFNTFGPLLANHGGYANQAGHERSADHEGFAGHAGHEGRTADHAGDAGREPMPSGKSGEHAGRHARKRRVRKIVPAVAAAAAIAGVAAYGLSSGGHAQARQVSAMTPAGALGSAARAGTADAAAAKLIKVAKATDPAASHTAKPAPRHTPAAAPSAAAATAPSLADAATSGAPATPATQAAAPSAPATPAASQPAAATTLSCNLSSGLLPQNVSAIVSFLLAHGYNDNAAAGIAGNMYQESKGDPEAVGDGGGGLIGFTPLPAGYVTGNATTDLQTQLTAVLTYNQIWSSYLPTLNSAASPADAADIYVTDFERAGIPVTATREASAEDVASACGI
jgi:hypothetical protein